MMRTLSRSLLVVAWVALLPSAVRAQSAIGGIVKDVSGAVLPGVNVEASSDVLIEKSRDRSTTDGAGQYKIVDLRPGVYIVTFTLPGFQTVKRENVELPTDFTATINAEMKVGALEESVTVSARRRWWTCRSGRTCRCSIARRWTRSRPAGRFRVSVSSSSASR